ncbi:hypothetical protein [Chitinophaga nivalis]|uniref:TIGR02646 family protein n=1 Tax=Chitinophaga nivalis TaxID=2991709 RepID=A0ABT3IKX4_9BACT|nr:hypothetical protein [Chitinophaga nivalis]MCW3465890.1 hypothetical protein [Chitinophaga nivalis]MCW3484419.1 hypothetical protein [Chitinophaga nivalis]
MIKINRPPAPAFLTAPGNKWQAETNEAIQHYSITPVKGDFEFKLYKDPLLKEELKKTFTKCAYCESRYSAVFDGDVEHFRPKGRVLEKIPPTPGYYWLANEWTNLVLSCQHCNQKRKHLLPGTTVQTTQGKHDQFPLLNEGHRIAHHMHTLHGEEPSRLLIDPCTDQDTEAQFEYDINHGTIIARSPKATTSIAVYALQRPELVKDRKEHIALVLHQMTVTKRELERYNRDQHEAQRQIFQDELNILIAYGDDKRPFAGLARFFIRRFLTDNNLTP